MLAGVTVLVAGSLWPLVRNLGLIGPSFLTDNGPQLGAALEIPLVLIGLYFRGRERRDSRVRLEALSHTDPLTGLGNHRVLMLRLSQLLARARRDPALGAVMRVRVANLHAINEQYGREAMEAAMVRAAECVARGAIEGDTVAREQGGDIVLVMEGQSTRTQIAETGRNIIARGLKFSRRLPRGVTLHFNVAAACAPLPTRRRGRADGPAGPRAAADRRRSARQGDAHPGANRVAGAASKTRAAAFPGGRSPRPTGFGKAGRQTSGERSQQ